MKQVLLILLLTSYTLSTLGIGVKHFYCCGKLKSTDITIGLDSDKKCAKDDGRDGCCKTTVQTYKVKDSHFAADSVDLPVKYFVGIAYFPAFFDISTPVAISSKANSTHAPPCWKVNSFQYSSLYLPDLIFISCNLL